MPAQRAASLLALTLFSGLAACDGSGEDTDTAVLDGECSSEPFTAVEVSAGIFEMGSPAGTLTHLEDEVLHQVTLTHDLCVGVHEITQSEFEASMGYNPSENAACGSDCPVETLNWHEAAAYANALSSAGSLDLCYSCDGGAGAEVRCTSVSPYACGGYRLLTEAEWEYAARAGVSSDFTNGGNLIDGTEYSEEPSVELDNGELLEDVAWVVGNAGGSHHPVGQLDANSWGLHDVSGNVWEWCHDEYEDYHGDVSDPIQVSDGSPVYRGGSYWDHPKHSRLANRGGNSDTYTWSDLGLRLGRTLPAR